MDTTVRLRHSGRSKDTEFTTALEMLYPYVAAGGPAREYERIDASIAGKATQILARMLVREMIPDRYREIRAAKQNMDALDKLMVWVDEQGCLRNSWDEMMKELKEKEASI